MYLYRECRVINMQMSLGLAIKNSVLPVLVDAILLALFAVLALAVSLIISLPILLSRLTWG